MCFQCLHFGSVYAVMSQQTNLFFLQASDFRFALERSTNWQFPGRKVQFSLTIDIPVSTPLRVKIELPFFGSPIMRFTEAKYSSVNKHLTSSVNTTTMTSSANDGLNDIAFFELGNITRSPSVNNTEIKIDFEVQLLNHANITNGGAQWVSVGAEYISQSVWASQMTIKTISTAVSRPDLKVSLSPNNDGYSRLLGYGILIQNVDCHQAYCMENFLPRNFANPGNKPAVRSIFLSDNY